MARFRGCLYGHFFDTCPKRSDGREPSAHKGKERGVFCILGDVAGGFFLIALSLFGVGAILAASSELFQIVKWAGVFYMAYLGYSQIREARQNDDAPVFERPNRQNFDSAKAGFLVGILNPKAIMFYVAFLSQFLDPNADAVLQFVVLATTATIIVGTVLGGYALLADRAQQTFQSEVARKRFGYAGGGFLLGGSFLMATR